MNYITYHSANPAKILTTQDVANYLESIVDTARNKELATILASVIAVSLSMFMLTMTTQSYPLLLRLYP